ncbi:MAG: Uma2 family endonuclease [Chloroflexi bacterium]|nr:Uma2 family endonuclease [Chloroflexota bacterium]
MVAERSPRRFDVDEYHWMARVGILHPDERVELLDGEIVTTCPIGAAHNAAVDVLSQRFVIGLAGRSQVRTQGSIRLSRYSEPEPDLVLLKPRPDCYRHDMARAEDVLLIVEVADSSLVSDRDVKLPLYARAVIPEVWLLDIPAQRLLVHTDPERDGYKHTRIVGPGDQVAPAAFPDLVLTHTDIFGEHE